MLPLHTLAFWSMLTVLVLLPALLAGLFLARPVVIEVRHADGATPTGAPRPEVAAGDPEPRAA